MRPQNATIGNLSTMILDSDKTGDNHLQAARELVGMKYVC